MANRIRISAQDDKSKLDTRVENLLESELGNANTFNALTAGERWELVRRALVLLLRVAKRGLK